MMYIIILKNAFLSKARIISYYKNIKFNCPREILLIFLTVTIILSCFYFSIIKKYKKRF